MTQPSREDDPLDSLISPIWRHVHEARAERDAAEAELDALRTERDQLREALNRCFTSLGWMRLAAGAGHADAVIDGCSELRHLIHMTKKEARAERDAGWDG